MTKNDLRNQWVSWLTSQDYSHAITLKPNNPKINAGEIYLRRNLNRFHRNLDRRLLGTRFADEKNGVRRTRMVAILEGLPYFGHIHAAVRISPDLHHRFEAMFAEGDRRNPWSKMIPGGSVCVERLHDAGGWHDYITKRFATTDHCDNLIFLPPVN